MKCILRNKNHANLIENAQKRNKQLKSYIFYESNPEKVEKYQREIALNVMKMDKWKEELKNG